MARQPDQVTVVVALDDHVVVGCAATLRSAVMTLAPDRTLDVRILDAGIRPANLGHLLASLPEHRATVQVLRPDLAPMEALRAAAGSPYPPATFASLAAASELPDASRAILLDCDLLVRHDLGQLFDTALNGHLFGAVPDPSAERGMRDVDHLPWREMGLAPDDPYVNTGVVLADLDRWRSSDVFGSALELASAHPGRYPFADQDLLNCLAVPDVELLDARWNAHSAWFAPPTDERSSGPALARRQLASSDPWVVHFASKPKPWHRGCEHPHRDAWTATLDATAFAGWRPTLARTTLAAVRRGGRRLRSRPRPPRPQAVSGSGVCT